jgi:hypothetical protein
MKTEVIVQYKCDSNKIESNFDKKLKAFFESLGGIYECSSKGVYTDDGTRELVYWVEVDEDKQLTTKERKSLESSVKMLFKRVKSLERRIKLPKIVSEPETINNLMKGLTPGRCLLVSSLSDCTFFTPWYCKNGHDWIGVSIWFNRKLVDTLPPSEKVYDRPFSKDKLITMNYKQGDKPIWLCVYQNIPALSKKHWARRNLEFYKGH